MRRVLLCLLPLALMAQSGNLVTTITGVGSVAVPSVSLTATTPFYIAAAFDQFSVGNQFTPMFVAAGNGGVQYYGFRTDGAGNLMCQATQDGMINGLPQVSIAGFTDFSAVCERDPARLLITLRVCKMDGSGCVMNARTSTFSSQTINNVEIGPYGWGGQSPIYGQISLIRMSTTLYGPGLNSGQALVPPNASNAPLGNKSDSEFAGSLVDTVGGGTWSIDWGSPSYTATTPHSPVCNAGNTRSQRAGKPIQLDGSASYALDGVTTSLNYRWSQTGGPSELAWVTHNAMSPAPGGSIFGQYDFVLSITDATGGTGSCGVSHGAVATDSKGNLLIKNPVHAWILGNSDQNNPAPHTGVPSFLGSEYIPDGTGVRAFPLFQSQIPINARNIYNGLVGPYNETTTPGPGTISIPTSCTSWVGSTQATSTTCAIITGTGTTFKSTFCGGTTTGPDADSGAWIVIWYKSLLIPGTTGRRRMPIKSCDSDTQITLGRISDGPGAPYFNFVSEPGVVDTSCGSAGCTSGVKYSLYTNTNSVWWFVGAAPGAYYDAPSVYYYLWYATGLNEWRDRARDYSDKWCLEPHIDCGAQFVSDSGWWQLAAGSSRCASFVTLLMRATDGRPEMWPGLRRIVNYEINGIIPPGPHEVYDLRESAYVTMWTALLAKFDPDSSQRAGFYTKLLDQMNNTWTPNRVTRSYGNLWLAKDSGRDPQSNYDGRSSTHIAEFTQVSGGVALATHIYTGTASVINGSPSVTGTGTNFLTTYSVSSGPTDSVAPDQSMNAGCRPRSFIWFQPDTGSGTSAFTGNFDFNGDQRAYRISTITDNTHMTLTENYQGPTGSKNYVCGVEWTPMMSSVQPYMLSIAMQAFWWTEMTALDNSDSALATTAHSYAAGSAQYLFQHSYEPTLGGQPYNRSSPSCEMSVRGDNASCCEQYPPNCSDNMSGAYLDQNGNRENGIESMHHLSIYCRYVACDATFKDTAYHRFAESWGKPGTGAMISDPNYVHGIDGQWSNPASQYPQKWLGYSAGTGLNQSALSALDGGTLPKVPRTIRMVYNASAHPAATKARMTVTDPTGQVAETTVCTSSPCVLTTPDQRAGNHLVTIDLLSASDAVVMPGRPVRLEVQ